MRIGLLGLQGAFLDHIPHLKRCGVEYIVVRTVADIAAIDRMIIPGGESTVMTKFLEEFGMVAPLKERIGAGMPVWGVCAGSILLAHRVDEHPGALDALPMEVTRNAYGRQIASDTLPIDVPLLGLTGYPAIFIRAPRIERVAPDITVHAERSNHPVFVQKGKIIATTFHPELNRDERFHRYFISL